MTVNFVTDSLPSPLLRFSTCVLRDINLWTHFSSRHLCSIFACARARACSLTLLRSSYFAKLSQLLDFPVRVGLFLAARACASGNGRTQHNLQI
jgi:hypothetical protein